MCTARCASTRGWATRTTGTLAVVLSADRRSRQLRWSEICSLTTSSTSLRSFAPTKVSHPFQVIYPLLLLLLNEWIIMTMCFRLLLERTSGHDSDSSAWLQLQWRQTASVVHRLCQSQAGGGQEEAGGRRVTPRWWHQDHDQPERATPDISSMTPHLQERRLTEK